MTNPMDTPNQEMTTWLFRVGVSLVGFILAIGLKDAKKSLDQVPGMAVTITEMQKAQEAIFRRVEELERGRRQ